MPRKAKKTRKKSRGEESSFGLDFDIYQKLKFPKWKYLL